MGPYSFRLFLCVVALFRNAQRPSPGPFLYRWHEPGPPTPSPPSRGLHATPSHPPDPPHGCRPPCPCSPPYGLFTCGLTTRHTHHTLKTPHTRATSHTRETRRTGRAGDTSGTRGTVSLYDKHEYVTKM